MVPHVAFLVPRLGASAHARVVDDEWVGFDVRIAEFPEGVCRHGWMYMYGKSKKISSLIEVEEAHKLTGDM